jgi:hypothetical protein
MRLRPSGLTHLLEQNTDIRVIQVPLGHARLDTTALYTRIATNTIRAVMSPLERLSLKPKTYLVSTGLACIGTPEDCVRHFEPDGGLGGILLLAHNWADWAATKRSYELMARYVHPQFQRDANALRQWSYDDAKSKYETAGVASRAAVQAAIDKYQAGKKA